MNAGIKPRLQHTTTAALVLAGAYFLYVGTVDRYLTPPTVAAVPPKKVAALRVANDLTDLFGPEDWQSQSCIRVQTADAMLLFKKWESRGGRQWSVSPVTIIYGRGLNAPGGRAPIVLQSRQGAEIEFDDDVDLSGGAAPPIRRGRLMGEVTVRRDDPTGRSMALSTTDIVIDRQRLYTTSPIEMRLGQATMRGRDLTLHLSKGRRGSGVVPDRLELIYLDQIHLPIESDEPDQPDSSVRIGCGGAVEFDFALSTLVMQDRVRIERTFAETVPPRRSDTFVADHLQLRLKDVQSSSRRRDLPDWFESITATGTPVRFDIPSYDAAVKAETLLWNIAEGHFQAAGRRGIEIERQGLHGRLAGIDYHYDPNAPKALGRVRVDGAGIIQTTDVTSVLKSWRWKRSLDVEPIKHVGGPMNRSGGSKSKTEIHDRVAIAMHGGCEFETHAGGRGHADRVTATIAQGAADQEQAFAPERVEAAGSVVIDDPRCRVRTDSLQLFFVANRGNGATDSSTGVPEQSDRGTQPAMVVRQPGGLVKTATGGAVDDPVPATPPRLSGERIAIELTETGKGYRPSGLVIDGGVELRAEVESQRGPLPAVLSGDHLQWQNGSMDTVHLTGVVGGAGPESAARLDVGDGYLSGPEIQVHRLENVIAMPRAGEFRVPSILTGGPWQTAPTCRFGGQMLFDGQTITLDGGVQASGVRASDERASSVRASGVRASDERAGASGAGAGQMHRFELVGNALVTTLAAPVDLMQLRAAGGFAPRSMRLIGSAERPVMASDRTTDASGVLTAKHQFHAKTLRFEPGAGPAGASDRVDSGSVVGDGPGWYRGWFAGDGRADAGVDRYASIGDGMLSDDDGRWGEPTFAPEGDAAAWRAVHLTFDDSVVGRMRDSDVTFVGAVRLAMQPVASPEARIDASTMDRLPRGASVLDCDRLRMAMLPAGPGGLHAGGLHAGGGGDPRQPIEVQASGSVRFRTYARENLLLGTAGSATYTSANDLFVVKGLPGTPATVRTRSPTGEVLSDALIRFFSIHPRTMVIDDFVPLSVSLPVPEMASRPR